MLRATCPGGGAFICDNFYRDACVIFLGLKFTKMSFFVVSLSLCHFLGLKKLPSEKLPSFFEFIEHLRHFFGLLNFVFRKL